MYGLEMAQLNSKQLSDINKFQLRGFRKILRRDTTHVNPANSNEKVMKKIDEEYGGRSTLWI